MSASSTPTASPLAARPSAKLAATVDLPTPPLPEATATIAPTPGTAPRRPICVAGPPCGGGRRRAARAGAGLGGQHRGHRDDPGQRLDRRLGRLAQRFEARPALGLDLDREPDIAVAHDDPGHHAQRDDVAAPLGVAHPPQRVENLSLGDGGHDILPGGGRNVPEIGGPAALDNTRARALYRPGLRPRCGKGSGGMIWKSEGGGPWGTGPRGGGGGGGGGPWGPGRGGGSNGSGPGPRGFGSRPPDFEEMLRRSQDRFRRLLPGGFGGSTGLVVVVIAIVVIWLASGLYRVQPDEVGVVLRFGAYNRKTQPGLSYHVPRPIESVLTPSVTRVNRTEIGYRSEVSSARGGNQIAEEALMLTGDENIVDINFT